MLDGLKIATAAAVLALGLGVPALAQNNPAPANPAIGAGEDNKSTDPQDQTGATTKATCDEASIAGAETTAQAIADGSKRDEVLAELKSARTMMGSSDMAGCETHMKNAMDMMR